MSDQAAGEIVGSVGELWRYPVKCLQGERITRAWLGPEGLEGDRRWAFRDEQRAGIADARAIPALATLHAAYPDGPANPPAVQLPDGSSVRADADEVNGTVSAAVGEDVSLWPIEADADRAYYRRRRPVHDDPAQEARFVFGLEPDDAIPDLADFPEDLRDYIRRRGHFFDAAPVLVVTDRALAQLAEDLPDSVVDVRRFRPNIVVSGVGGDGFPEFDWVGRRLRVGDATVELRAPCIRCVMVTRPVHDVPGDRSIMRRLVADYGQNFGVYAVVTEPGEVAVGAPVELS